jgi:putative transferase (TIGR04331 family)
MTMATPDFLATTALTEFWDLRAEKLMFLGAWCLRYDRKEEWQNLDYELLPHPWDDRAAMHQAARYEEEVYEDLLIVLGDFLNAAHSQKYGRQYWRIILGPWLLHYIQALHERYLCLTRALDRYPEMKITGLAAESFNTPRHFWDHLRGGFDDPYNLQLYTIILEAMGRNQKRREFQWNWEQLSANKSATFRKKGKRWLRQRWRNWGFFWARRAPVLLVDMYQPLRGIMKLMLVTGLQARWCDLPEPERWVQNSAPASHSQRQDLGNLAYGQDDEFISVLIKTLPANLPLIYLEGYQSCREWVRHVLQRAATKIALTSIGTIGNETYKILAAELHERGAKLVDIQHGGSYGNSWYSPPEILQRKAGNEFWSWGWGEEMAGVRPMPNPKLSYWASKPRNSGNNSKGVGYQPYIFYVGNNLPRYHFRTWSCPTAQQTLQYLDWTVRFFKGLGPEVMQNLIYRPFPDDYGWAVRQRLQDACPDLRLDSPPGNYYQGLRGASLVVCDMNQTTVLESLAMNIPTIAFWDPHFWEIRPEAEPYFQLLRQAGILHDDPEAAAAAVVNLWPRFEEWWGETERQQIRQKFVQRFALNSPEWAHQWQEQLEDMLSVE